MPKFQYEAMNAAGQAVKDHVDAASPEEAAAKIKMQGHYPTKIKETRARRSSPTAQGAEATRPRLRWNVGSGRISQKKLTEFTQQLFILQDAGLPILRSLKILEQQDRRGTLKSTLAEVAGSVEDGATLSEAFAKHPKAFDRLYVNMVQAGEAGGVLDVILQRLAEFMEKAQRLRWRVIGAMIYPFAVITFSALIVTGIMVFVVPKFNDIFKEFHAQMPRLTLWLMAAADFIAHRFGWAMILGMPVAPLLLVKLIRKSAAGRLLVDSLLLRLPVVGRIVRKTAISRFARTLGTLLAAGVPILDALNITRETVGNRVFTAALQKVHDAIREGESFATPLRAAGVCDAIVTNMIDVGEETGELDKMLIKIADTYDEQVDVLVSSLVSLLEPVMVITLGTIVGTIVLALILPMVEIMKSFN